MNPALLPQAFEENEWHRFVDDPLCPAHGIMPEQRLRDTVKNLNRTVSPKLIRFSTDGTGTRVLWRDVSAEVE